MALFSTGWGRPTGGGFFYDKASEPISSRAQDYNSPGDNSSPAGKTIPAGSGTSAYDGEIVWWSDFTPKKGKVTASFAVLFKDCLFAPSFSLLKLYADKELIVSNTAPLRQSNQKIRFHDGTQTTPDPLLLAKLGADKVSSWPGLAYAVFEDFDCTPYGNHVPLIRAVLSGVVTAQPSSDELSTITFEDWATYDPHFGEGFYRAESKASAADFAKGQIYVVVHPRLPSSSPETLGWVVVVDVASNAEISRSPLFDRTGAGWRRFEYIVALQGSDYFVVSNDDMSSVPDWETPAKLLLVNAMTGEIVKRSAALGINGRVIIASVLIEGGAATRYLVFCDCFEDSTERSGLAIAVVDITNLSISWIVDPFDSPAGGANARVVSLAIGPVEDGQVTFYWTEQDRAIFGLTGFLPDVRKGVASATGFSETIAYSESEGGKYPQGVAYDEADDSIVVLREDGSIRKIRDAATVYTAGPHAVTDLGLNLQLYIAGTACQYVARPGHAFALDADNRDIYAIDLADGSISVLADLDDFDYIGWSYVFHVDGINGWIAEYGDWVSTAGQISLITSGDATPGQVDLVDIFTQLATYDGRFEASDLVFVGFPGNECQGFKLENDTTIDDVEQSIAAAFDVKIVESDGKRKYFWPPRDGAFAVDQELAHQDFVETGTQTNIKTINAGEDEYAGVTFGYYDQDADYQKLEQPFDRPRGIFDVTRSKKRRTIPSLLSMTASQALRAATLAVFRSVLGNETYAFGLRPGMAHVEPADIVAFDFRNFRTVARIREATFKDDYTQDCLAYQYLQYSEATYDGASLTPPQIAAVSLHARLIWLDTPLLTRAHDLGGTGLVQYAQMTGYGTAALASALLYRSDDGAIFTLISERSDMTPVAGVITAISGTPTDPFSTDFANTIHVAIGTGDPASIQSVSAAAFYNGANLAAIGRPGAWVLIHYQDATVSDGVAELSTIIWGAQGSEVFIGNLAPGDLFVPLDPAQYSRFSTAAAGLGETRLYKAATALVSLGTVVTEAHVSTGAAEKPYACVNLRAAVDGSDIDLAADARSRLSPWEMFAADPDSGEAIDAFEWDIMDGDAVVRTLESSEPAVTYADADIVADFGALPATLTFRLAKMSTAVGRGHLAQATITL
ncbi:phage tail protein [Mesorhizobium sp. WSM3626]|uniref:phage tail protein n=1 Tax=Mesorhizobium sp. WSM3626 TaxID=1040987 RepID=UPI000480967A|nr:phage tail protein [Mesorhizobium sp. WSM3626]